VWYLLFFYFILELFTTVWYLLFFYFILELFTTVWYLLFFYFILELLEDLRLQGTWMDEQTDGRMDGWTDGRTW
jgi:hypothetical protein